MNTLIHHPRQRLFYARDQRMLLENFDLLRDGGEADPEVMQPPAGWEVEGDWHIVTVYTNEDKFSGLDGGLMLDSAGSWLGGVMQKTVECGDYCEIVFEHCVKSGYNGDQLPCTLTFRVDGLTRLAVQGPSPWKRTLPMGLPPGTHILSFSYEFEGSPSEKAGIVDTLVIWQAKPVPCLIASHTPPKPVRALGRSKVLRGFTRFQEMSQADTEITFTALFTGPSYHEFMLRSDGVFYFLDEFGVCYRGIFPENINPACVAIDGLYSVELTMLAGQKTGVGFC